MDDLVAFLRTRLEEDQAVARFMTKVAEKSADMMPTSFAASAYGSLTALADDAELREDILWFMGLYERGYRYGNDPERMLREVEAKRRVVDEYAEWAHNDIDEVEYAHGWANGLGFAVRHLAAVYSDHPDHDPSWLPDKSP